MLALSIWVIRRPAFHALKTESLIRKPGFILTTAEPILPRCETLAGRRDFNLKSFNIRFLSY